MNDAVFSMFAAEATTAADTTTTAAGGTTGNAFITRLYSAAFYRATQSALRAVISLSVCLFVVVVVRAQCWTN